ncbi:hypothetical protein L6452_37617 [Arctium lappa]|uniref:Uncharacterized protein n=1 Tax=Arctium lappa TaxID=4217 RepID=A0ACB8Y4J4_ARCLA|nr:hypothetical protein L6452_37617 [Arctium lappa]
MSLISDGSKKSVCIPRITYPSDDSERESHDDIDHSSEAYLSEADDEGEDISPRKPSPSPSFKELSDKADKYKANYKREKERNFHSQRRGKGLKAETLDWADEPTFDSEKEVSSYWKEDADYTPSEDIPSPSPSQNLPLSSKLSSYSSDWNDSNS